MDGNGIIIVLSKSINNVSPMNKKRSSNSRYYKLPCVAHRFARTKKPAFAQPVKTNPFMDIYVVFAAPCAPGSFAAAKPPVPVLVVLDGPLQVTRAKIRPKYVRKIEFRISKLPQQKVAQPHFTACSY